jgi:hypothetical protein
MKKMSALRQGVTRDLRTIVIATAVASAVTAAPAVADLVVNADKVDGKHAVSSKAPVEERKNVLVATHKKTGLLPNDIIAKAPDSDRLDGLDSADLRVTAGGKEGSFVNIPGCGDSPLVSYPLQVTRKAYVSASATTWLAVLEADIKPSIYTELLDSAGEVVARTSRATHTGGGGNWGLDVTTLLFSQADSTLPYEAAPGSYTLRMVGDNSGSCDSGRYNQYGDPRLSHLLVPTGD